MRFSVTYYPNEREGSQSESVDPDLFAELVSVSHKPSVTYDADLDELIFDDKHGVFYQ